MPFADHFSTLADRYATYSPALYDLSPVILGPDWPPERRLVDDGYHTVPFPFREVAQPPFTLEARWTLAQLLGDARVVRGRAPRAADGARRRRRRGARVRPRVG